MKKQREFMASNVALKLQKMLLSVIEKGTGQNAQIPHFNIAGKTGTAQKIDDNGKYSGYIPNFVAFPIGLDKNICCLCLYRGPEGKVLLWRKSSSSSCKKSY